MQQSTKLCARVQHDIVQGRTEYWPCRMENDDAKENNKWCRIHGEERENDIKINKKKIKNKLAGTKLLKTQCEKKYKYG